MTTISMTSPVLEGGPVGSNIGDGIGPGPDPDNPPDPHPPPRRGGADHDVGDIKMAVRTADHVDGAMTWFFCDGRAISRATYALLFATSGVAFGPGDGIATFNIPRFAVDPVPGNPAGRFPVGVSGGGYPLGTAFGAETHLHDMTVFLVPMAHIYNPNQQVQGFPTRAATLAAGVQAIDVPHSHLMPNIGHGLGPYSTDFMVANAINPHTAVGFFIRVL